MRLVSVAIKTAGLGLRRQLRHARKHADILPSRLFHERQHGDVARRGQRAESRFH